jgi:hypothetical protein
MPTFTRGRLKTVEDPLAEPIPVKVSVVWQGAIHGLRGQRGEVIVPPLDVATVAHVAVDKIDTSGGVILVVEGARDPQDSGDVVDGLVASSGSNKATYERVEVRPRIWTEMDWLFKVLIEMEAPSRSDDHRRDRKSCHSGDFLSTVKFSV